MLPKRPYLKLTRSKGRLYAYFIAGWNPKGGPILSPLPPIDSPEFEEEYRRHADARIKRSHSPREANRIARAAQAAARADRASRKRFVYFIVAQGGAIKIGIATSPRDRLDQLRTAHPEHLTLVAMVEGDEVLEKAYHERFAPYRIRGEWFDPHPSIWSEIARIRVEEEYAEAAEQNRKVQTVRKTRP